MESSYAVRYLLPAESVETFYLLFPDPWPKRRHWRRRIVTGDFLCAISQALAENGKLLIATDHVDYFEKIMETARGNPNLAVGEPADVDPFDLRSGQVRPLTKFERKFRAQSIPIHWLALRKVLPGR
jgi:tRNA (guanine-N7-)-methyltransferase